jgi:TolA-binding protein
MHRAIVFASSLLGASILFASPVVVDLSQQENVQSALVQGSGNDAVSMPSFNTARLTLEQRITRLEQIAASQTQNQALITQLQQQIEALQGQNDVLRHDMEQLKKQQQTYYQDLNTRLTALEKNTAASVPVSPAASTPVPSNTATISADQKAYQSAYALLGDKKYSQAIVALQGFVKQYPQSAYVPEALYWQAEVQLTQNNTAQAKILFEQLIKNYPKHPKTAAAQTELARLKK